MLSLKNFKILRDVRNAQPTWGTSLDDVRKSPYTCKMFFLPND